MAARKAFILAALALAVAILSPASALANAGGTDRPFKSEDVGGIGTLNLLTGEFSSQATEIDSHCGKGTSFNHGTIVFTGPGTLTLTAEFTFVAANGDHLTGTFGGTGTFTATDSDVTVVSNFTGGTGRFADATGGTSGVIHNTIISSIGGTLTFRSTSSLSGHISY